MLIFALFCSVNTSDFCLNLCQPLPYYSRATLFIPNVAQWYSETITEQRFLCHCLHFLCLFFSCWLICCGMSLCLFLWQWGAELEREEKLQEMVSEWTLGLKSFPYGHLGPVKELNWSRGSSGVWKASIIKKRIWHSGNTRYKNGQESRDVRLSTSASTLVNDSQKSCTLSPYVTPLCPFPPYPLFLAQTNLQWNAPWPRSAKECDCI